mgnify:CR=1 FL=1
MFYKQVEFKPHASELVVQAVTEVPREALPPHCRPGFGRVWMVKESHQVCVGDRITHVFILQILSVSFSPKGRVLVANTNVGSRTLLKSYWGVCVCVLCIICSM